MITCPACGQIIREIRELSEVQSLGLAMRGKCPGCGSWVFCEKLWKKTKFIDLTASGANRKDPVKRSKTGHNNTPKAAKNRLEAVLAGQKAGKS